MSTASAIPDNLLSYRDGGLEQVAAWEAEVPNLDTALTELRTALAAVDLPENCQLSVLFYETWFETLVHNQRHLDEWVGDVANQFILASGGQLGDEAPGAVTVDDSGFALGHAARAESEEQGEEDAEALAEILGDAGIMHPYDIENDPEKLEELVETYPELRDILARSEQYRDDEAYAAALVNELGADDVRIMVDLANTYGLAHNRGMLDGDAYEGYVVPFAQILGAADRSGLMDDSVRDAIFDLDASDEPALDGYDVNWADEPDLSVMRHRSLALLLDAGEFSAQTTADLADTLTDIHAPTPGHLYDYEGWTDPVFLQDHRTLTTNEWAAFAALAENDAAANLFFAMDRDEFEGELENFAHMNGAYSGDVGSWRLGISAGDINAEIEALIAQSVQGGLLEHPLAMGTTYDPETTALVSAMIDAGGWEHMDAADSIRDAMARVSTPYTNDLAIIAAGGGDDLPESRLNISADDLDAFFQEVSESERSRIILSQNGAALVDTLIGDRVDQILAGDDNAFGNGERLGAAYYRALGQAWDEVQIGWSEQREALVSGWRTVTDPLTELVSGKIVDRIPVVNAVNDLPIAGDIIDGITSDLNESINSAIYDELIPEPELQEMEDWSDTVSTDIRDSVATALYDDPGARQELLDRAEAAGADVDSLRSGGVDLDEFRSLEEVQNVVNAQSNKIINGMQTEMAFDWAADG